MKKAWVFLIALALLAFSMPVFAQAPAAGSFHAWNQGNLFPYYAIGSNASMGWGPLWDAQPGIDQEWTFSYDGNNYGFNATLEFGMDNFSNDAVTNVSTISWFATYYKFGDLVKVTIGKPRFNDYTEFSQVEGNNYKRFGDSDFMAIAQVFPVAGLSIAGALYVPVDGLGSYAAAVNAAGAVKADYGNNFGVAAAYAVPNLLTVKVMYRASEGTLGVDTSTTKLFGAGINVGAVQGLTINGAVQADLSNSAGTVIKGFASVKTSMIAPLALALDVALVNDGVASTTAYAVEANLEYPIMGQWVLGANVGYDSGSASGVKVGWFNQGVGDWTGFEIYPYIKANFDNGSSFKVGFVYGTQDSTGASNAVIAIPIIYVWSF